MWFFNRTSAQKCLCLSTGDTPPDRGMTKYQVGSVNYFAPQKNAMLPNRLAGLGSKDLLTIACE